LTPSHDQRQEFPLPGGYPQPDDLPSLYDELDYQRACQLYIWATPAVGMEAISAGLASVGLSPESTDSVGIFEHFLHPHTVVATGNGQSIYAIANIDLSATGPAIVEVPGGLIGFIMSGWQQPLEDVGLLGPDQGKGGKFLLIPPGADLEVPDDVYPVRSDTFLVNCCMRGFLQDGKPDAAVAALRTMRIHRLADWDNAPAPDSRDLSGEAITMIAVGDAIDGIGYFELLARFIAREPAREQDKQFLALARSLGIAGDQPFAPDDRMRAILTRAARTGHAMVAAISYLDRDGTRLRWPGHSAWEEVVTTSGTGNYVEDDHVDLDGRAALYYQAAGASKRINLTTVGAGSKYAATFKDAAGAMLDGSRTYRLRVPPEVPAKNFWSVVAYDAETRSMIQTDTEITGRDSYQQTLEHNDDGSVDLYLGPTAPDQHADNWIPTRPGVGFFLYFRWYGPLEAYFDKTWILPDLEPLDTAAS
jgi:hypothetical protein